MSQKPHSTNDIERIIDAVLDENISPKLKAKMLLCLFSDSDRESKQDAFVRYADKIEPYMGKLDGELRESYNRLAINLGLSQVPEIRPQVGTVTPDNRSARPVVMRTYRSRLYIWTRVAAVLVPFIAILGTYFALENRLSDPVSEGTEEIVTRIATIPLAEQTRVGFFPDSTYISIKPGSTADYKESAVSRRVELSGEAFFKVTHDEARPFHVSTDRLSLTVLGTHFNVTDHPDNSISEVSLFEGSVLVTTGGVANTLSSGQRLRYDSATGEVSVSAIPASEMTAGGYTPRLIFDHATLGEVLDALSAYYGTTVDIGSGMDRTAGDLSVNLEGLTLEQSKELLLKIAFGD